MLVFGQYFEGVPELHASTYWLLIAGTSFYKKHIFDSLH